jgi:hypothetical protein
VGQRIVGDDLELLERVDVVAVTLSPGQLGVQLGQVALQHRPVDPARAVTPKRSQHRESGRHFSPAHPASQ